MENKEEVKTGEIIYYITDIDGAFFVRKDVYTEGLLCPNAFKQGNIFTSEQEANNVLKQLQNILKPLSLSPDINEKVIEKMLFKFGKELIDKFNWLEKERFELEQNSLIYQFASEITELFEAERKEDKRLIEFYIGEHTNFISTFTEQRETIFALTSKLKEAEEEVKRLKEANTKKFLKGE